MVIGGETLQSLASASSFAGNGWSAQFAREGQFVRAPTAAVSVKPDAARILGVTRPRVSDVVHAKSVKFTIDALVDMLARAGRQVTVSVR